MGYAVGGAFFVGGVMLFRKGGALPLVGGAVLAVIGLAFIGLSVMVDAKKNGVI